MTARRDFLAFTAGAVAARTVLPMAARAEPAVVEASHPDAPLLAACAAFSNAERELFAAPAETPEDVQEALLDSYNEAYQGVSPIRPQTMAGLKAKASVVRSGLLMMDVDEADEEATEWEVLGAWRLVQDVLALAGGCRRATRDEQASPPEVITIR